MKIHTHPCAPRDVLRRLIDVPQPERLVKQARGRAAGASRRRAPDVPAAEQQEIPECRGEVGER